MNRIKQIAWAWSALAFFACAVSGSVAETPPGQVSNQISSRISTPVQAQVQTRVSSPEAPQAGAPVTAPVSMPVSTRDSTHSAKAEPTLHQRYPRYTLRSGDSFELNFQFSPEFNQTLTVEPDGYISLREVGGVHVSGMTLPEVQKLVEAKYATILKQPVITVTPKDLEKSYFIAMGEVQRPGRYELRGPITVTEAIAIAGGLAPDRAKTSEVVLFHRDGAALDPGKVVNVKHLLKARNLSEDMYVKPGDLIYVPQSTWSKIHSIIPTPGLGMSMYPGSF